jgi:hypothetical protein
MIREVCAQQLSTELLCQSPSLFQRIIDVYVFQQFREGTDL